MSKKLNLAAISIDEMWQLHEEISQLLCVKLTSEKRELEKRLAQLRGDEGLPGPENSKCSKDEPRERRKYPRVFPKYRNPDEPSETWSGRGKQPRWLAAALKRGHKIEKFVIGPPPNEENPRRRRA
jgi:DNA-binding protein H-NS